MDRKEKFLHLFKLFEERLGFEFDVNNFKDKIKLQKLVYISEFFGFNHGYPYNKYIKGPYSPSLADDYYSMNESEIPEECTPILDKFDYEDFLDFVVGKDSRNLELIATVLSVYKDYRHRFEGKDLANKVIDTSADIKSRASMEKITSITLLLNQENIIELDLNSRN